MKPFKLHEKENGMYPLKIKAVKLFTEILKENGSLYGVLLQLLTILKEEAPDARIYACGGIVRDTFLHIFQNQSFSFKDLDLVIEGISIKKLNHVLERLRGKCSLLEEILFTGAAFSVWKLKVINYSDPIDLALTRTERSFGSHHKDFEISNEDVSIQLDASRRDFTMNALCLEMLINPDADIDGRLYDFHKGLDSIIAREIKCVGEPEERFREDPLRMLRAIRFRAKFPGFNIEKRTSQAIYRLVPELLRTISKERMADELHKALVGDPEKALKDFRDYGIFSQILPEIAGLDESAYKRISGRISYLLGKLEKEPDSPLIFSALLLDVSIRELANRMRMRLDRSKVGPWFLSLSGITQMARQLRLPCVKKISHFCNNALLLSHFDFLENADAVIEEIISRCEEKDCLISLYTANQKANEIEAIDFEARLKAYPSTTIDFKQLIINSGIPLGPHLLRIKLSLRQAEMEGEIQNLQDAKGFLNKLYLRETHLIQGHISKISRIINSDSDLPSWSKKLSEEIRWMLFTWPVELIKTYYDNNLLSKVFPELAEAEDSVKSTQFHFVEGFLNDTTLALSILCEEIALPTPVQILSLLFLDIGKSKTKGIKPDGSTTYYGHERAGAEIAQR